MKPPSDDPKPHARRIGGMLLDLINHCREDSAKVTEPRAQALFEKTSIVLAKLRADYEHYLTAPESVAPLTTVTDGKDG